MRCARGWSGTAAIAVALAAAVPAFGAGSPQAKVVATGLNNPRAIAIGPDGAVYVAEAGKAGPTCLDKKKEQCIAFSGSVTRIKDGKSQRVVTGLLSGGGQDGSFTGGPAGVSVTPDGTVYVTEVGLDQCRAVKGAPPAAAAQIGRVLATKPGGRAKPVAEVSTIECRTNPDGTDRNSNPYAVLALGGGREYVVDAGANDLLEVTKGKVAVAAVFPKNGKSQAVPTSIVRGPDGAFYVGELAEGAGKGKARVFRVVPGQKPTVYRTGFTAISGLAFGPDKSLYVTELSSTGNFDKPSGAVVKVSPDGKTRTVIGAGTLLFPSGAGVADDGTLYVSNFSILPGTTPKKGPFGGRGGQVVAFAAT
jgi:sugar lactone lactonase YvrE